MAWCLVKSEADKVRKALKDGTIDPGKLSAMTSEQRRAFFKKFVTDENAKQMNSLFESKLLLKNQQRGMITWAKRALGLSPRAKRDIFARIERLENVLTPVEEKRFLKDLASTRLGIDVSFEEGKNIADLSKKLQKQKEKIRDDFTFEKESDRLAYGRAKIALSNYVNGLKLQAEKRTAIEIIKDPVGNLSKVAGNAKAIRASMDNSAIFRQGWRALWTHPRIWLRNAKKSFGDIWRTFGKREVMDELNADLVSRPNAINENYKKMRLALGVIEEEFPESFAARIPAIGRAYKASENAFTAFVYKTRADIADKYIEIADLSGVDLDERELRSIGKLTNSLTARGSVGPLEPVANVINNVFWSPRKLKADIDFLTMHAFDKNFSSFARKQAGINLLRGIMGMATILGTARAMWPETVELDPRSANFGRIVFRNTRFDVTGGIAPIITLVSRLVTNSSKSSTTNKITTLNTGEYGAMTKLDVIYNFFENKLSPASSVVKDLLVGQDFDGNKLTAKHIFTNLFIPLPIANIEETSREPEAANIWLVAMADMVGIGTNTYSAQSNWKNSTSKKIQQFREVVGEEKFKRANQKFIRDYNTWLKKTINSKEYNALSEDGKKDVISSGKEKIQEKIFKEYGFRYKTPKKTPEEKIEKKTIKKLQPK